MLSDLATLLSEVQPFSAALATLAVALIAYFYLSAKRNLPPGPTGLPYLGMFPFLRDQDSHQQMSRLTQKYGDIFCFTFTGTLYLTLGTAKLIREAHVTRADCFERMQDFSMLSHVFGNSVTFVNGENWKVLRKFFTQAFREFGMISLRDSLAGPIHEEVRGTIQELRATAGSPVDVTALLTERCCGVMRRMLFGEDGISHEEMVLLNESYALVLEGMTSTKMLLCGRMARYLLVPWLPSCRKCLSERESMLKMLDKIVQRRLATFDEGNVRDVIDCYFKERNERRRKNDPTAKYFTTEALVSSLVQFVGDGVLSIAIFIGGFLQALVEHPVEQEKVYRELLEVVGADRPPSMEDKSSLPYTSAFIHEVVRGSEFFPFFPSMQCAKETTLRGYRIPKGCVTLLNIWSAHHDPSVYENPTEFNPSRFLSLPDKPRPELPVLFGIGRRSCAGEAFTMMQVFLFLTAIVHEFEVSFPEGSSAKASIFYTPEKMKLILRPRQQK